MDTIVFDIETKESFDEVGERDPKKLSLSLVGAYSYLRDEYQSFLESELAGFWQWLKGAEMIVGFNSDHFDIPILEKYWPQITSIQSLDLLKEIKGSTGFRVKLNSVAEATLGEKKSADGFEAIRLFKEGRIDDLRRYCLDDVRITRDIYEFGKQEGIVLITDRDATGRVFVDTKEVPVNFNPEIKKADSVGLPLIL